ncbi:hypothetical protein Aduo_015214 [Ancylostoma duodenale]
MNTCLKTQPITEYQLDRDKEQIVLMTAEGSVWNERTNQFEKILFFFDTGAQKKRLSARALLKNLVFRNSQRRSVVYQE